MAGPKPRFKALKAEDLGALGVVLIILGVVISFSGVSMSYSETTSYYYSATGLTYTKLDFTDADNATEVPLTVGTVEVNVTPIFPPGSSGSVTVMVSDPLSTAQLVSLGASDPSTLGTVYLALDLIITWSVTGANPTVYVDFEVPGTNIRAYYWDGSSWVLFPGQNVIVKDGKTVLRVPVTSQLTGTPVALLSPAPVGGTLAVHGAQGTSIVGLAIVAVGAALVAASAALALRRRHQRS